MELDLISIIIPCYNASRYLNDVFLSIKNQTYQNLEVVFVDDGSTDDTPKMLDEFAKDYSKAKVIHKVNEDVSVARNTGIKSSKGKYIYFMDSDDIIHPDTISYLYNLMQKHNADVVNYRTKRVSSSISYLSTKFKKIQSAKISVYNTVDEVYTALLVDMNEHGPTSKLFKRDILKKLKTYPNVFNKNVSYGEDSLFLFSCFKFCERAVWSKAELYYYRQIKNSKVHSNFKESDALFLDYTDELINLDPIKFPQSSKYTRSALCLHAMDLIRKFSTSDYKNPETAEKIYRLYRDNLKYLPHLSRYPLAYRFGTLFTLPVMYLMIRKKLKG